MPKVSSSTPRISAVITAYNCAEFLPEAIESVLAQTHPVDEIVIVDDGSTDETGAVAAAYASTGVRYIWQENKGAGAARNRGVQETSGDLIAFLDGDDVWLPGKTKQQLDYLLARPDVAMVSGHKWWCDVDNNKQRLRRYGIASPAQLAREIVIRNEVGNPSMVLMWRAILDKAGPFDPNLRWGQDWELWIRIAAQAKIGFLPQPVILYRWHPDNLSHRRRWERISCLFGISRRAISRFQPAWQRPLLLARAWSQLELNRALYAIKEDWPRRQQFWHAGQALLAYPFEKPTEKLKVVGRALVGENFYRRLRARVAITHLRQHLSHRKEVS